jgi:hypothetical protein
MARPRKSKVAVSILHNESVEIRLMALFLEDAMRHAEKGELIKAMSNLRNAYDYEQSIPTDIKLALYDEARANG